MKKLIIFLILSAFLAVSCSSSKKANDTDLLPDEDVTDIDENDEEEEEEPDEDADNDDDFLEQGKDSIISIANICTGQTKCYDNEKGIVCPQDGKDFYGQDYQYAKLGYCKKQSFSKDSSVENEPTYFDNNLKIEWAGKIPDSAYSWDEATKYCEDLDYGGHDDWRLPLPQELMLADNPLFSSEESTYFWSSQIEKTNEPYRALKINPKERSFLGDWTSSYNKTCCVRGKYYASQTSPFTIVGKNMVKDNKSSLWWLLKSPPRKSWKEALDYCENLTYAGLSDWRLPNVNELFSITDLDKCKPASNFPNIGKDLIYQAWSSTTMEKETNEAGYINFDSGTPYGLKKNQSSQFFCVRNEPCEENYLWNGKKCEKSPCKDDPCGKITHSDGTCYLNESGNYYCGCVENHFWNGKKCVNPCDSDPCKNFQNSTSECAAVNGTLYKCVCKKGFYWWGKEKGCIEQKPTYGNICTGQDLCYDNEDYSECHSEEENFFGQDAQYADMGFCAPQNFSIDNSVENEKTVIDNNTGLEWQQTFSEKISSDSTGCPEFAACPETTEYCENLIYGGHNDWRVPSINELLSILDIGKHSPSIDTNYFPNTPHVYFLSSSYASVSYGNDSGMNYCVWGLNFYGGLTEFCPNNNAYVRCVRGEKLPLSSLDIFVGSNGKKSEAMFNSNGTLIWQAYSKSGQTWENSLKYCENLNLAGLVNWRLPNKNELFSAFPPCRLYSAGYYYGHNYEFISDKYYWSSSSHWTGNAFVMNYGDCEGIARLDTWWNKTQTSGDIHTRCVTDNPCSKGKIWNGETCVETNPCEPNPCSDQSYSTKTCIISTKETAGYFCECSENSFWSSDEKRCIRTCNGINPCIYYSNSDQKCYEDEKGEFYCGCVEGYSWNSDPRKCLKNETDDNDSGNDTDSIETPDETDDTDGL